MSLKYDAVISGYLCVDMLPEFQKIAGTEVSISGLFKPGKLIEIDGLSFSLGGVVANTGMAMKRFGKSVFLNGLIGTDMIGEIAKGWLDKYNLSEGIKITGLAGTAFGIVIAPPGIDRIFLESPGCSKVFDIGFVDFGAVAQSRLFHFGYPPLLENFYQNKGGQLLALFSKVHGMGVTISLDFSLPDLQSESGKQDWLQIMERVLPYTDIFVPSLEEIVQIMMPAEYARLVSSVGNSDIVGLVPVGLIREIGRRIIGLGVKILLIKAGYRGIYMLTGEASSINRNEGFHLDGNNWNHREIWCEAYSTEPVKIKNATGAGDTAAAAFLSAILEGLPAEESLKLAAVAGRDNLYCQNIFEEMGDWQCLKEEILSEPNELIRF